MSVLFSIVLALHVVGASRHSDTSWGINLTEKILAIQILLGFLSFADSKHSILDPFIQYFGEVRLWL